MKNDTTRSTIAYKGYLIKTHPINGTIWIESGGWLICWAESIQKAKNIVDQELT